MVRFGGINVNDVWTDDYDMAHPRIIRLPHPSEYVELTSLFAHEFLKVLGFRAKAQQAPIEKVLEATKNTDNVSTSAELYKMAIKLQERGATHITWNEVQQL